MLTIQMTRTRKSGNAVFGKMVLPFSSRPIYDRDDKDITIDTLENALYIIPAGTYPLRRTYSYKFKKLLPLVDEVPDRSGIRILKGAPDGCFTSGGESGGNGRTYDLAERYRSCDPFTERDEHSTGCILTDQYGQSTLDILLNRIETMYNNEEILLQISDDLPALPCSGSGSGQ